MKITVPTSATTLRTALGTTSQATVAGMNKSFGTFKVKILNLDANTIYVEGSGVTATTANGYTMAQNASIEFEVTDLSKVSLIAGTQATDVRVFITT